MKDRPELLEALERCTIQRNSLAMPEEKLQEFVNSNVSPQTLQSNLASGRIEDAKRLLDRHFGSVAKGDFIWLQEL